MRMIFWFRGNGFLVWTLLVLATACGGSGSQPQTVASSSSPAPPPSAFVPPTPQTAIVTYEVNPSGNRVAPTTVWYDDGTGNIVQVKVPKDQLPWSYNIEVADGGSVYLKAKSNYFAPDNCTISGVGLNDITAEHQPARRGTIIQKILAGWVCQTKHLTLTVGG
jgi:hypothetical protein